MFALLMLVYAMDTGSREPSFLIGGDGIQQHSFKHIGYAILKERIRVLCVSHLSGE